MKTNKSLMKRVKITAGRKIMKRPPGQNHFNAKNSGSGTRNKHGFVSAPSELDKKAKHLLTSHY